MLQSRRAPRSVLVLALALAVLSLLVGVPRAEAAGGVNVARDVVFSQVDGHTLRLDAYLPDTWSTGRPAVVLVHGGGWHGGRRDSLAPAAELFARHGWVAVTIDYRLAPAATYPAAVKDVQAAVRFVRERAARVGVDPARIVLAGSSAGGNLATLAAMSGKGDHATGARVAGVVSWSGVYDMPGLVTQTLGDPGLAWLGDAAERYVGCPAISLDPACLGAWWVASPTNLVDPTDPPVLLVHGRDELVPVAQATAFATRLELAGVERYVRMQDGTGHGNELILPHWNATLYFIAKSTGVLAAA